MRTLEGALPPLPASQAGAFGHSATSPTIRGRRSILFDPRLSPYLAPDGSPRRTRRAPDVGAWTQDGVRSGARIQEQALVHAGRRHAERGLFPIPRPRRIA